ncbi:hypothetical protein CCR75_002267 [Bremia lactucae]|uniref:Uncharacterized protein n=1 Tax=Bremia lactucae TaxID=4779 RepID=A0A976FML8_BRELC|nr:hypothetical protein CCR75_002267 [Bremia lactucae]
MAALPFVLHVNSAETAVQEKGQSSDLSNHHGDLSRRFPRSPAFKNDPESLDPESRNLWNSVWRLFRFMPRSTAKLAESNEKGVARSLGKVREVVGDNPSGVTKVSKDQVRTLSKYASTHRTNWNSMLVYLYYTLGIGLFIYAAYGAFFLGFHPYGMGGSPRAN